MGADTVAASLLLFIAVLGMTTLTVVVLAGYVGETTAAVSAKQKDMVDILKTEIEISSVNSSATNTLVYAKNIGNSELRANCTEIYIDDEILKLANVSIKNPNDLSAAVNVWDLRMTLLFNTTHLPLDADTSHTAKVVACNGVSDSYIFSVKT